MASKNLFDIEGGVKKTVSLNGKYKTSWLEDSFDFEKNYGQQITTPKSHEHLGNSFSQKKTLFFLLLLLSVFLLLISKIFYLQIIRGGEYRLLAEGNRQRLIPIASERGLIYDRNGVQLTKNIPSLSLALVPQDLPRGKQEKQAVVQRLADLTGKTPEDVSHTVEEYGSYSYESIIIEEDIDYETALSIQIAAADLPGINIVRGSKRLYTLDDAATSATSSLSHVLGYQGKINPEELEDLYHQGYLPADNIGKAGIEKTYEAYLRGIYGRKRIEVNAFGKEQSVIAEEAPTPGFHLKLTIDTQIQNKLQDIIASYLEKIKKTRASAIALNPQTGEILALVSLPTFDNNDFSGGISYEKYQEYLNNEDRPLFNRSIAGTYPSGSTIKPAIAASALQEGIITPATSFLSTGGIRVGEWFFPDWQAGGHGQTNVRKSLAWSVNTFYYYIGGGYGDFVGLGVAKITEYLREFGFANKLGIDIPSEAAGFLPSKEWKEETKQERWYVGDTYNLSIGQGDLLVTPLQIANMTASVANGGILYKPHIAKSLTNPITKEEVFIQKEVLNSNFIDSSYINTVKLGMKDCVDYGSCRRLASLPFTSGGKTGTAQWSSTKDNHAWYTSFAPFDNPEIIVTILIEEGGQGSDIAVPVAYDFYKWWSEQ